MTARTARGLVRSPAVRFLIVGGANTAATAALVVLLSLFLPGWLAFTIAFAVGLVFSVLVTGRWVFQTHLSAGRAALFAGAYIGIYGCGLAVVRFLELSGAPPAASGASVLITAPLSFLAGRLIFAKNNGKNHMNTDPAPSEVSADPRP